jgi:hypothetical protein
MALVPITQSRSFALRTSLHDDQASRHAATIIKHAEAALFLAMSPKGDNGKTTVSQVSISGFGVSPLAAFDCNPVAPTLKSIGLTAYDVVDLAVERPLRALLSLLDPIRNGVKVVVCDCAAYDERKLFPALLEFIGEATRFGVRVCVVRLMGADIYSQAAVSDTSEQVLRAGGAVLAIENLGQGRTASHFNAWRRSEQRTTLLRGAFADCQLQAYDRQVMDNASALGLSLEDVALNRLDKKLSPNYADRLFPWHVRADLARYLLDQQQAQMAALADLCKRWS